MPRRCLVSLRAMTRHPGLARIRAPAGAAGVRRPHLIGEIVVALVLLRLYDVIRRQVSVQVDSAIRHGEDLLAIEARLRVGIEHALNAWIAAHPLLSVSASYWYEYAHASVTMAVLAWCWWWHPAAYRRARNALVGINIVALVVFMVFPTAPPRLLPAAFGFVDSAARAGFGANHSAPATVDQYGSFPSLHLAWAVWVTAVAYRLVGSPALRRLWLAYPVVTGLVVIATANHYLIDVLAGAALALLTLRATATRCPESI